MALNIIPKVVDLSHYDDLQDINKVKAAGILGIVNKATEGPGNVDTTFAARRKVVLDAGIKYGSYHFVRPGDMAQQVAHHLSVVGDVTGLMVMLDWETNTVSVEMAREWVGHMHDKIGRWPVVYSYSAMLREMLGATKPDPVLAKCRLWVAAYSNNPTWPTQIWPVPFLWQFTGDGNGNGPHQIPGIVLPGSRGIDVDAYEGGDAHATDHTDSELLAEWADGGAGAPSPVAAAPAVAPTAAPAGAPARQTGITATCFGGAGDSESSAYGGVVDPTKPGVALPFHFQNPRPKVKVTHGTASVVCEIVDVGPHNTDDAYWSKAARPQAEIQPGNKAGIDLTPAVFAALGIGPRDPQFGRTAVDWEFA